MTNVNYTIESLQGLNSTDLRKAGTLLGIKNSSKYKKEDLLPLCIEALPKPESKKEKKAEKKASTPKKEKKELTITADMQDVIDNTTVSKSSKMRELFFNHNCSIAEVTKALNTHYSFVYETIKREFRAKVIDGLLHNFDKKNALEIEALNEGSQTIIKELESSYKLRLTDDDLELILDKICTKHEDISNEKCNAFVGKYNDPTWM